MRLTHLICFPSLRDTVLHAPKSENFSFVLIFNYLRQEDKFSQIMTAAKISRRVFKSYRKGEGGGGNGHLELKCKEHKIND